MKDVGSVNYTPPNVEHRNNVFVHRSERPAERQSVTVNRTPVVESHREVESRGSQETVVDAKHRPLYSKPAATFHETTDQVSQALVYTQQAATVKSTIADESHTLLDMRA